jgi:hypothetical protein
MSLGVLRVLATSSVTSSKPTFVAFGERGFVSMVHGWRLVFDKGSRWPPDKQRSNQQGHGVFQLKPPVYL